MGQGPDVVGMDRPSAGGHVEEDIVGVVDIWQLVGQSPVAEVRVELALGCDRCIGRNLGNEALGQPVVRGNFPIGRVKGQGGVAAKQLPDQGNGEQRCADGIRD